MRFRKKIALLLVMVLLVFNTVAVQANNDGKDDDRDSSRKLVESTAVSFSDVPTSHWAYNAITLMANYQIITGYKDGTFKPDAPVTRAEFAKMMVLTMQMDLINPGTATFVDVQKGSWDYKYIETAKPYMTAFKSTLGLNFRPTEGAQREDMAVAIIKGLKIAPSTDLTILNTLTDQSSISANLKGYVAAAVSNGIMVGDGNKKFNPNSTISRAETATLLARLINDEKIVFDEEKVVLDDNSLPTSTKTPFLVANIINSKLVLDWTGVESSGFSYYKVVLSKADSTPSYPDNGYAAVISNVGTTAYEISAGDGYNSGDLGGNIQAGTYYAAITAVYGDAKITSNVVVVTVPVKEVVSTVGRTPVLSSAGIMEGGIKLEWTRTENNDNFKYYKVVLSKTNAHPSYPNDGYVTYISDNAIHNFIVKAGQDYNGDAGKLESGRQYYVAITAVYSNGNQYNTSNVITVQLP